MANDFSAAQDYLQSHIGSAQAAECHISTQSIEHSITTCALSYHETSNHTIIAQPSLHHAATHTSTHNTHITPTHMQDEILHAQVPQSDTSTCQV